jgi:type 1 glutamine amidotransferase
MRTHLRWPVGVLLALSITVPATLAFQQPPQPAGSRGFAGFVTPVMDTTPPELPKDLKSGGLLIFSKTNGYRDEPSVRASNAALLAIAKKRGWPAFVTENAAIFNADQLKRFKVTVWNNTSGNTHTEAQRAAFKTWLENGGAFVGIHGAGGDPKYDWAWYPETLIGAQFTEHSSRQLGTVHIEDRNSSIMKGLPADWIRTVPDEWYSFKENPRARGMHILATAVESTYAPGRTAMGADHPMVWTHCVGKGRVFYSAIGHPAASYTDEPLHLVMLENAMAWALGKAGGPGCPAAK